MMKSVPAYAGASPGRPDIHWIRTPLPNSSPGDWLISKVRVSSLDRVAATVDAPRLVEDAIFGEDLVDGRAPTRGVVFTEDIVKIAGQQGRYAVGHGLSPLGIECAFPIFLPRGLLCCDCEDLICDQGPWEVPAPRAGMRNQGMPSG
jgi:hypothetical protein